MSNCEDKNDEVPRTAPIPKECKFEDPTTPVVPEVSMVSMEEQMSGLLKDWRRPVPKTIWRQPSSIPSSNVVMKKYTTYKPPVENYENYYQPLQVKSYKKSQKTQQRSPQFREDKPLIVPSQPISNDPSQFLSKSYSQITSIHHSQFLYPPPPIPPQIAAMNEQRKISDNIFSQLKSQEIQIVELKKLIEKLTAELIEFKKIETAEHEKTREILMKPKIYNESIGIQCKLNHEITFEGEKEQDSNERSNVLKYESTGAIPKGHPIKELIVEKHTEINQINKYEILSGLPKSKCFNETTQIMELTCKYIPKDKLKEWGVHVKEPGKTDVSIATRRYMEKYGLIGPIPEEKDSEEEAKDPRTAESNAGDISKNKILDTKAIKKQPKFM